jgi:DNA-directed RNA polymerase subunit RPC12/RpoP
MESAYKRAWDDYRRRRRKFMRSTVLLIILFPLAAIEQHRLAESTAILVMGLVVVAWLVFGCWMMAWRCPRCGNPFFHKFLMTNSMAQHCLYCGLHKWAVEPENGSTENATENGSERFND